MRIEGDSLRRKLTRFDKKKTHSSSSFSVDYSNEYWRDDLSGISYGSMHDIFHPEFRHKAEQKNDLINFEKKELRRTNKVAESMDDKMDKILGNIKQILKEKYFDDSRFMIFTLGITKHLKQAKQFTRKDQRT